MSTHATENTLEQNVESADAGPKLAETETKLTTEPMHGDEVPVKKEDESGASAEENKEAPVCLF